MTPTDTPIKLLFIVSSLAFGGAEKQTVTLINGLPMDSFTSSLAYLKDNDLLLPQIQRERLGGEVFCCHVKRRLDRKAVRLLASYIREQKIDIVVCVNPYPLLYGWLARVTSGRHPLVVEIFHTTQLDTLRSHLEMLFYRPFFRMSDMLVYVSQNQRRFWRARALRACRDAAICNGIDATYFDDNYTQGEKSALRQAYGFSDTDYVVGLCAAMRPEKAHGDLLQAVSLATKSGTELKCLLIGDGPERRKIERQIEELQMAAQVAITGFVSDVRLFVASCDAIALVSHSIETFSIAALEAMAMGKPMVMSRIGSADEQIIHGVHGYLFRPRSVDELASHLRSMVGSGKSPDMGQRARNRVISQFSAERMLASYQALFVNLVCRAGKDDSTT